MAAVIARLADAVSIATWHHITSLNQHAGENQCAGKFETTILHTACMIEITSRTQISTLTAHTTKYRRACHPRHAVVRRSCHSTSPSSCSTTTTPSSQQQALATPTLSLLPPDNHGQTTVLPVRPISTSLFSSFFLFLSLPLLTQHPSIGTASHPSIPALHLTTPCLPSTNPSEHPPSTELSSTLLTSRNHARLHHRRHPGHGRLLHGRCPPEPTHDQHNHYHRRRDQTLRSHMCRHRSRGPRRSHLCWCRPGCPHPVSAG